MAEAEIHDQIGTETALNLTRLERPLGQAIASAAPDILGTLEASLREEAKRVEASVEGLREAWTTWAKSWHLRRTLGHVAMFGGTLPSYQGNPALPKAVQEALDALTESIKDLDKLKADEANVTEWRAEQAAARAWQKRTAGGTNEG